MAFALTAGDDPLGKATAGDIVLTSVSGGAKKNYVEMLAENGVYIKDAAKSITPITEKQISYELRSSSLTIPLGALIDDWVVTSLSASCTSRGYPTVSVTAIKFSSNAKYKTPPAAPGSVTIAGGFGVVDKFGATADKCISSQMSVQMQSADRMADSDADYMDEGYTQYGFKKTVTVECYSTPEVSADGLVTEDDGGSMGRTEWGTQRLSFFEYL